MAIKRKKTKVSRAAASKREPTQRRKSKIEPVVTAAVTTTDLRARLREDIINCSLTPGQRLKFEELRTRYDAGIGSLREALLQLESDGLVITESNRGFCVAPVSIADLEDITELRVDIERKALTDSILHGDDAWEASIVASLHMLLKMDSDISQASSPHRSTWEERHRKFHDSLVAACSSTWLKRFRRILWDQSQRYRALSMMQSRTPGRANEHRDMMEMVVARNVQGSVALMEQHIRHTSDNAREWLTVHGPEMAETDFSRSEADSKPAQSTAAK